MGAGDTTESEGEFLMADTSQTFDQAAVDLIVTNFKQAVDNYLAGAQQQNGQQAAFQQLVNQQFLRFVEDQHTLVMRSADSNAQVMNRQAHNAVGVDHMVNIGALNQQASANAMSAKVAADLRDVATQTVEAAMAAVPGTSAASQGTTGVAQGGLQMQVPTELAQILTNNVTIQTALLKALADINTALGVIVVKVTGEEVTAEKP